MPAFASAAFGAARSGDDHIAVGVYASMPGACELSARFLDDLTKNEIADSDDIPPLLDDLEDLIEDDLPEDFWLLTVLLVDDNGEDIEEEVDVDDTDDLQLTLRLCHFNDRPQREDDTLEFDTDCYSPEDGVLSLELLRDQRFSLRGNLELVDREGDDAGDVTVDASASVCAALNEEMDDMVDACEDSQNNCSFAGEIVNAALFNEATDSHACNDPCECEGRCECEFTNDGVCDEAEGDDGPALCPNGTDVEDCQ